MDCRVEVGRYSFGVMKRDDVLANGKRAKGWFASQDGAYAPIGPGSTGSFWAALRGLWRFWRGYYHAEG